jgi:hypothetical protein
LVLSLLGPTGVARPASPPASPSTSEGRPRDVQIIARDGQPSNDSWYLLAHLTSNPLQAARYLALGLPSRFQAGATSTDTPNDPTSDNIDRKFIGDNLGHTIQAVTIEPPAEQPLARAASLDDAARSRL